MSAETAFAGVVGAEHVLGPARLALRDPGWCAGSQGAGLLVRPASVGELSGVMRVAAAEGLSVVAQGGLTGLVDGTESGPGQVIVSFERMARVLEIDVVQGVTVVEPGVTLAGLDAALEPLGLMVGVDIAARDSCTIGGMVATNAGGTRVLRYGMTRASVLGLEVVLADGTVLDLMVPLLKNNAGYDLKQVFIGSEGTLGLVSKVALRVFPRPVGSACALVGLEPGALGDMMVALRAGLGEGLAAIEAMWPGYYDTVAGLIGLTRLPLAGQGLYVIVEATGASDLVARSSLETCLEPLLEAGLLADAVIAQSQADRAVIWRIREESGAIDAAYGVALSYDVGLRLADLQGYVERLTARSPTLPLVFGHVGDGNLHVMFALPKGTERAPFDALVYDTLTEFSGSTVSAEHGIGLEKRAALHAALPPPVLAAMRVLKAAFDPQNRLNPGKVL